VKESMDLYEEFVTEEQQSKEKSYTELMSRFQAAQNQIKELHKRLEQMETQNTGLNTENFRLKKNISALLKTARQEVIRKDAEIQRLNQMSEKGHHYYNNHREKTSFNLNSKSISSNRPQPLPLPPPSSSSGPVPPSTPCPHPPPPLPPLPPQSNSCPPPLPPHPPTQNQRLLSRTESCSLNKQASSTEAQESKQASHGHSRSSSRGSCEMPSKHAGHKSSSGSSSSRNESEKHKSRHREDKYSSFRLSEHTDRRPRTTSHPDKDSHTETNRSHKKDKYSGQKNEAVSAKNKSYVNADGHHRSDRSKSPPSERSRSPSSSGNIKSSTQDKTNPKPKFEPTDSEQGAAPRSKDHHSRDPRRNSSHDGHHTSSDSKKPKKSASPQRIERSASSHKDKGERQKREEKRHEDKIRRKHKIKSSKGKPNHNTKETQETKQKASSKEPHGTEGSRVDENSPNRKLCFMETLNLTISPIKKSALSTNDTEECAPVSEELSSETTHRSCDDAKNAEEKDRCPSDSGQAPEDNMGKTDTDKGQIPQRSDNPGTLKSPKPLEGSVHQSTEDDVSNSLVSNSLDVTSEAAEVTKPVSDTCESTINLPKTNPEDDASAAPDLNMLETEQVQECVSVDSSNTDVKASTSVEHQEAERSLSVGSPTSAAILDQDRQEDFHPVASLSPRQESSACPKDECPVDADAVSSTIMSKVSSTTEEVVSPGKSCSLTVTPKKEFTPSKRHDGYAEPSSSVLVFIDEDSMMRTLSSLKGIPDVISPIKSPMRMTKRSHLHGKLGLVKSLQKDFSSPPADKKLDVNKENKSPGSPAEKRSDLLPVLSDTELEEGEILSESDEAAAASPSPANKRAKLILPVRKKTSPKSVLKSKCDERSVGSKEASETTSGSSRSPKSRFKTVCPASAKASFSTVEEVMETFKLVRSEIRKKYMKLHKTFPRRSFYGMMENFQESFLDFVNGANFCQICIQVGELKSKLKKMITSVFTKVSNNGIVKRIFEQQAVDLKQRLWDFVDVQVDYMFRDICVLLNSFCKPTRAHEDDKRPSKNEKIPGPPALHKSPKKDLQSPPSKPNHIKPAAPVPYPTGLGSRGKDIRIMHEEKDCSDDPPQKNSPQKRTIINFLPPRNVTLTPEKSNASLLDKTDFELLTEQQASSLTFNLVRDSQMGEIFKCLLQGSELLEHSNITGESTSWSLGTPRKDGDRIIGITTPNRSHPNPSFLDESCLLELPSGNKPPQSRLASEKSYSILAEDLAVSLTIPSPLKSEGHLSFLQPPRAPVMSTPDSVISAHISEDALLEGEDASEQDIHLSLDTDNSSGGSSSGLVPAERVTSFVFKPDVPMQALVMEKSNDHFILKIRPTTTALADVTLKADESLSQTLIEANPQKGDAQNHKSPVNVNCTGGQEMASPSTSSKTKPRSEEDVDAIPETERTKHDTVRKRKKHRGEPEPKRRRKTELDSPEALESTPAKDNGVSTAFSPTLSPNSLSAKNVVRKKGEVVMSWSKDEDRTILLELKTRGASRETFAALSDKLNKPSSQVTTHVCLSYTLLQKKIKN
uniref:Caspase 8 associated protein 2 n=1 Tax=Cynoglossus semilaevis TaxID=244447 RepID=A0A3P8WP44_CYNSE